MNYMTRFRVWLARRLVWGTNYELTVSAKLGLLEKKVVALHRLSFLSGHLSRAYHAGKAVRYGAQDALDALLAAQERNGAEFNDTYAAPLTRRLYGGEEAA